MLEKLKKLKIRFGLKSAIIAGVCVVLILIDIVTKIFEERYGWDFTVIPKFIEVKGGSRNPGCAFSFLADSSWGQPFLIAMTFLLLIVLVGVYLVLPEKYTLLKTSVCLITAGAIGNLIDRIAYRQVRDFVGVRMFGNMVSCNFADFWIVFGTALAIIDILFLNDWALVPLTKRAKAAHKLREEQENKQDNKEEGVQQTADINNTSAPCEEVKPCGEVTSEQSEKENNG